MKISLTGWESESLRSPDIKIDLMKANGNLPKVALIQMPNGTGKTTTLELLSATLNGSAERWDEEKILSFRRVGSEASKGHFIVHLLIDDAPLSIQLVINFENSIVSYKTTYPSDGGVVSKWSPPPEIMKFLSEEFLKLFIFDGEFAAKLLDDANEKADHAIDALCQLYLVDKIRDFARNEWSKKSSNEGAKTEVGLKQKKSTRSKLLSQKTKIEKLRKKISGEQIILEKRVEELDSKISQKLSSDGSTKDRFEEARIELGKSTGELKLLTSEVIQAIRNPIALHSKIGSGLNLLKENLDQLRLPENTSSQFFEELKKEKVCICGREMTEGARTEITNNAHQYLDSEDSGVLNALKADIGSYLEKDEDKDLHEKLSDEIDKLRQSRRNKKNAKSVVDALEKKLTDQGDNQVKEWREELNEKIGTLQETESLLKSIDAPSKEEKNSNVVIEDLFSLELINNRLDQINHEISKITKTVDLNRKIKILENICEKSIANARNKIRLELTEESNTRLKTVLKNDPIEIEKIERNIKLVAQKGASVGQTLSVGYAFLMSVLSRGKNDFPLVVDSPAGSIERVVRKELAALIPSLCHQFIGFTINTEFDGFVPVLKDNSDDCIFLTLFRITEGTKRLMPGLPSDGVVMTNNAVLVSGYEYFCSFDQEDEDGI